MLGLEVLALRRAVLTGILVSSSSWQTAASSSCRAARDLNLRPKAVHANDLQTKVARNSQMPMIQAGNQITLEIPLVAGAVYLGRAVSLRLGARLDADCCAKILEGGYVVSWHVPQLLVGTHKLWPELPLLACRRGARSMNGGRCKPAAGLAMHDEPG